MSDKETILAFLCQLASENKIKESVFNDLKKEVDNYKPSTIDDLF